MWRLNRSELMKVASIRIGIRSRGIFISSQPSSLLQTPSTLCDMQLLRNLAKLFLLIKNLPLKLRMFNKKLILKSFSCPCVTKLQIQLIVESVIYALNVIECHRY